MSLLLIETIKSMGTLNPTKKWWVHIKGNDKPVLIEATEEQLTEEGRHSYTRIYKDNSKGTIMFCTENIISADEVQEDNADYNEGV